MFLNVVIYDNIYNIIIYNSQKQTNLRIKKRWKNRFEKYCAKKKNKKRKKWTKKKAKRKNKPRRKKKNVWNKELRLERY